jgi:hypothetical protein
MSEKGQKIFGTVPAVVSGDYDGTGPFVARFEPQAI